MTSEQGKTGPGGGGDTTVILRQSDIAMAVNAFMMADKSARDGNERAAQERQQHLRTIQKRYWQAFYSLLSSCLARRRSGALEFSDDERLFLDMGLVDARMAGDDRGQLVRELVAELHSKDFLGSYYFTDWLLLRRQQLDLESDISGVTTADNDYASQLYEARRRVLSRLSEYLVGLPGIPLEVSESMRSGELDRAVIAAGLQAMRQPRRGTFLRRHNLWKLREQILTKARARVGGQSELRLFELLNEIYGRDWRERFDAFSAEEETETRVSGGTAVTPNPEAPGTVTVSDPNVDALLSDARQIRMCMSLIAAVDGLDEADVVYHGQGLRVNRSALAEFMPLAQTFDRKLAELPPVVILPMLGRGFFEWDLGVLFVAMRPLVGVDDSVATALAWYRMFDDMQSGNDVLRRQFEKRFPGAVWEHDFPADYRAWMTRLTKGDASAMNPARRAFFRECVGPDITGPILPPNLRNVGPQTMVAICRRLEKQVAADEGDVKLHRRLAALYWSQGNAEAAGLQFNAAMQADPNDGETFFSAGMFMRGQGDGEAANDCFRFGAERAADNMWGIYCRDALENQL